jgi:hypothetical protein
MNDSQDEETTIDFDDIPQKEKGEASPVDPRDYLPKEIRLKAGRLPKDKAYTLLSLKPEGDGHNASLLSVAATCFKMGVSFDDTLDHLQVAYSPDRLDYETAPRRAVARVWEAEGDLTKITDQESEGAPDAQEELLIRFRRTPSSSIVEASPDKLATPTRRILQRLFDPEQIINIQQTALEYGTLVKLGQLEEYLEESKTVLNDYKFLNPAHFKKVEGVPNPLHPKNKVSTRCNENVKARPWMVLEMDSKDIAKTERFNTFAMTMSEFAPLVLAVDTGNKSIHFWFDAHDVAPKIRAQFFALSCLHGADKRLGVKSQIARMPNVTGADNGRGPQKVLYFDPTQDKKWDLKGFEKYLQDHKQLDYYYHGKNRQYMTRDNLESWVALDRTSLRSHLGEKGYRDVKVEGETVAPMDEVINSIQLDRNIEAVVPGASGRHAGVYEENGHRVIVTKSPIFIKARRGEWPTIANFIEGLLGHTPLQTEVLYGWMSDSIKRLRNEGRRRASWAPCQMLHIMGPANAGKTLLLQDILTPAFAGRSASADPLFKKNPDMHNPDTFACELLFLDDSPVLESNYAFRQDFGERIKSYVVGITGGMRDMHQGRINIRPWWRFVRLMNMEPSTFATLPPLDEGVEDKLIFLRGGDMQDGPLRGEMMLRGWYERVKVRIESEMPAFLHFLLDEFVIPDSVKDPKQRYPVCSYKEETVMNEIADGSPESSLMHRFDFEAKSAIFAEDMFSDGEEDQKFVPWVGGVDALYDVLSVAGSKASQMRFSKTCPNSRVLLSQLRTLKKRLPMRVIYSAEQERLPKTVDSNAYWVITPRGWMPPKDEPREELEEFNDVDLGDLM